MCSLMHLDTSYTSLLCTVAALAAPWWLIADSTNFSRPEFHGSVASRLPSVLEPPCTLM